MRIATFNINNVNKRLPNLLDWLADSQPDVVCLQELKAEQGAFPIAALEAAGYGAVWRGQRTWNGVAILAKGVQPILTRQRCPAIRMTPRRATSKRRSAACSSPRSISRTATRSRGPGSPTSWHGSSG